MVYISQRKVVAPVNERGGYLFGAGVSETIAEIQIRATPDKFAEFFDLDEYPESTKWIFIQREDSSPL